MRFPAGVKIAFLPTDVMPFDTALAVDTHGNAWGWGFNSLGQLCLRNGKEYATPVELPLSGVTALAGAGDHALYDSKGHVFACGNNANGDLGDGNHKATARPVPVKGLQRVEVSALVAAFNNSAVLLANGTYEDWGYDGQGQLGDGAIGVSSDVPVTVALSGPVTQVTQGGSYSDNGQTLAMLADGALYSWGDDEWGQLGDGATTNEATPIEFAPPFGVTYAELASAGSTSYTLSTTHRVYAWGGGADGQIGNGSTNKVQLEPAPVLAGQKLLSATATDVVTG